MKQSEGVKAGGGASASMQMRANGADLCEAHGRFTVECVRDGDVLWIEEFDNVVCTEGKDLAFDTFLSGSSYTVTGPFIGLISSVSFSAVAATDVGTQINGTNGWKEAGGANAPTYSGNRPTASWAAASGGSKALSAAQGFSMTGSGTVEGVFILFGSAATHTKDDAHGTLWSAGTFTGGARSGIQNGDTLNVTYTTSM